MIEVAFKSILWAKEDLRMPRLEMEQRAGRVVQW